MKQQSPWHKTCGSKQHTRYEAVSTALMTQNGNAAAHGSIPPTLYEAEVFMAQNMWQRIA